MTEVPRPQGKVDSRADAVFLLDDSGQEGLLEARYRLSTFDVQVAERNFTAAGASYHAGSWIIPEQPGVYEALRDTAKQLDLTFIAANVMSNVPQHSAKVPRLGVWVPWADTNSIGWVRYSLDQRKVPYIYLRDEDIRARKLREKIDVLLYGHVDLQLAEQIHWHPENLGPHALQESHANAQFWHACRIG